MKKVLSLLVLFSAALVVSAQDVIVKKDGSTIISKVLEIGISEIKYKKIDNQDGPNYSIAISDVLSVNFENGYKESFDNLKKVEERQTIVSSDVTATGQKDLTLKAGTLIPIQNVNYTRAASLSVGQTVLFRVARDVVIDNTTIIPYGTPVKGTVYQAKKSSWFGTKGRLGIAINEIELPSGIKIPLTNGNVYITGKNRTAASVLLFLFVTIPACFITGSKAEMPVGYEITAEVARPIVCNINNGHLAGNESESESTMSNEEKYNQKKVLLKKRGGPNIKAIIQYDDNIYYYYKLQSRPEGRTYKIMKSNVEIVE